MYYLQKYWGRHWNIMITNTIKRAASEVMWPIWQYSYSGNFLACHQLSYSFDSVFMFEMCQRQFATRTSIFNFYQHSLWKDLPSLIILFYLGIQISLYNDLKNSDNYNTKHEDCILLTSSSKNLALYHVHITSQTENSISYGTSVNWCSWWRKS